MAAPLPAPQHWPPDWPNAWRQALGDDALRAASGPAIFDRGLAYSRQGAVRVTSVDPLPEPALRAEVHGSAVYHTEVWIEDGALAGDCDCPSAADGDFCKHQVALALVWRQRLGDPNSSALPNAPTAAAVAEPSLSDFLHGQDRDALAAKLLDLALRDRDVALALAQWQKLAARTERPQDLEPLVSELLDPGERYLSWRDTPSYVNRADDVLPLLASAVQRDPSAAVGLSLHALRRAWAVMQEADDSDGAIGDLCASIGQALRDAVAAAAPLPADFADDYLALLLDDPIDCVETQAVEAAMGEVALTAFRQLLAQRWRQAKQALRAAVAAQLAQTSAAATKTSRSRAAVVAEQAQHAIRQLDMQLQPLERHHLGQLTAQGQYEQVLAILREDLSETGADAYAHHRVVSQLEAMGRYEEALAQGEAGAQAFPGNRNLEADLLRGYQRAANTQALLALRQAQFLRQPSAQGFHDSMAAAVAHAASGAQAPPEALRQALLDHLLAREAQDWAQAQRTPANRWSAVQRSGPEVSLRAEILADEGRWLDALAAVQAPAICQNRIYKRIALHLPESHRDSTLAMLHRLLVKVLPASTSPHDEALDLVKAIGQRMDAGPRLAWFAQLRNEQRAKRNFVRDLKDW